MSQPQTQAQDASASTERSTSRSSDERSRISNIEKSVTHLLHATKTLLEVLTRWSKLTASENEVSDVYVRLGYEFNIACRAFNQIGVDTQDLGPVPDLLRSILEETLSGEPSQAHLDRYLPRIRDIIVNLLQGLKKKQQKLRQRQVKENSASASSTASAAPSESRQSTSAAPSRATSDPNASGAPSYQRQRSYEDSSAQNGTSLPPRYSSTSSDNRSSSRDANKKSVPQPQSSDKSDFAFASPPSGPTQDVISIAPPPYPQESSIPDKAPAEQPHPLPSPDVSSSTLQPKGDALSLLQRGGELERRASRRFSAYQIGRHLGTPSSGISLIPPAQNSPIPNRGRELKESMNAVRVRGPPSYTRDASMKGAQPSPTRANANTATSPAEVPATTATSGPIFEMPAEAPAQGGSPYATTPQDKIGKQYIELDDTSASKDDSSVLTKVSSESSSITQTSSSAKDFGTSATELDRSASVNIPVRSSSRKQSTSQDLAKPGEPSDRPTSSKELTLFLQYKTRIKKFVLPDGYDELSIARLQLAFIEKFAWNTTSNGVDLPEIYLQDPISGVRHELEDLADVKNHSVLVLNIDAVEEVKKHLDDGIGGLKTIVQELRNNMADQQVALQRVSDKQQDTAKEITRLATSPAPVLPQPTLSSSQRSTDGTTLSGSRSNATNQLSEVQSLRRDLAVMRQAYTTWVSDIKNSMTVLHDKAAAVKSQATSEPSFPSAADTDGSPGNDGRAYVNTGRKKLNTTSENLMTRVEELQDTVEDLRKDVVTRGVRPLPRQLETVSKELSISTTELKKLKDFIKREKPTWTKIWKDELQVVCDDQNLLTLQEELCADLEADLEAASQTFSLVEEATKQQNLMTQSTSTDSGAIGTGRSLSRTLNTASDPVKAKDGVLDEVRALQPNHETRLEAIERAEKLRQRELESRKDGEFQKELSGFVDEGRLKKSGGVEEAERVRKVKDEMARKAVWERMNGGRPVGGPSPSGSPAPENQLQLDGDAAKPPPLDIPSDFGEPGTITPDPSFEDAPEAPLPSSAT